MIVNIGIIHGYVGGGGGTEKTLHGIIEALEQTDHNVTLYTFSKPKISLKKFKIKSSLPITIPFFGLYQRAMESKLISKAKNEDILIQASGGLGIPVNPNQKMIVYCHSDFTNELENPATKYKGIWSLYYKSYYSMIKKFTKNILDSRIHLISNSQHIHDSIQKRFGKDSTIIYPPVNLNEFSSSDKENRVISIGRFSEEKNFDFGINVMNDSKYDYDVIGNTKTKSNLLYYKKLLKLKKNSKIRLLKDTDRKDLVNHLNRAKIYFHCSSETFGISIIESIAAGCIPIVPNNSAHVETVPFDELRYIPNDVIDAKIKLKNALDGKYDQIQKQLTEKIQIYEKNHFKNSIINYINNLS